MPIKNTQGSPCRPTFRTASFSLFLLVALGGSALGAGLEGVSYTITPTVEFVRWDEKVSLEDDQLYGGRLSFNFGRSAALQGYYLTNENLRTNLGGPGAFQRRDTGPLEQDINLVNYGADVVFNLSRGPVVPFVMGGGGVLRFDPESGDRFRQIGLRAGGGVRFGLLRRFEGVVYFEDSMFRLDRNAFLLASDVPVDMPEDSDKDDLRHNLSLGVGVNFFLGGYSGDAETEMDQAIRSPFTRGLAGASFPVEPFGGELQFSDDANLDDEKLLGVRGGVDFGRLFGLRAFYWRGTDDDFGGSERIQGWGGEAQFNLSAGRGITPYVVVGAGELDFMKDFRDRDGMQREDKTALILGGGLNLNLSRRLDVSLTARDYIFSKTDLEETADPDDLLHNTMFTVGVNFSVGGRGVKAGRPEPPVMLPETAPRAEVVAGQVVPVDEVAVAGSIPATSTAVTDGLTSPPDNTLEVKQVVIPTGEIPGMVSPVRTFQGDRVVTFPVPTVGEIYIRYGAPGGVQIESNVPGEVVVSPPAASTEPAGKETGDLDQLRSTIRDAVQDEMKQSGTPAATQTQAPSIESQLAKMEERLVERMDRLVAQRVQDQVGQTARPAETAVTRDGGTAIKGASEGMRLQRITALTGVNVDSPEQFLLGTRLDLGAISPNSPISFVPEFEVGVTDETSYMVTGNFRWDISALRVAESISPYISAGFGVLSYSHKVEGRDKSEGVLNFSYGFAKNFGGYVGFLEHQGVDLFSLHRILLGVTFPL